MEIVTNKSLIEKHEDSFILAGQCFANSPSEQGGKHFSFDLPSHEKAVIVSKSLQETFAKGLSHNPVSYLYRGEVQGDFPSQTNPQALPAAFRIIRIMPVLTIKQDAKELMHLTLRGHGASDAGHWGCASSLVSSEINQRSVYATLNRETGILIDGQVAVFEPIERQQIDSQNRINSDAVCIKKNLAKTVSVLRSAFEKNGGVVSIPTQYNLPVPHDTVSFSGAFTKDVKCIAHDNPEQRTLTLIFPLVAEIPTGAVVTPFNGEGYETPAALVNSSVLTTQRGIALIPGLRQFVVGN